ncbi:MAG: hypothetical protein ACXAEN_21040 [Candidatus Thorarchaeota archaeon]|jgi:hypothetical protein
MVKFNEVDPNDIPNIREGRRGRVSYPILKGFLETGFFLAELDRTGIQQSLQSLNSSLGAYIRSHNMPIKIFQRKGNIFLMRLDMDEEGNAIEDWQTVHDVDASMTPVPITSAEVAKRAAEEVGKTTK